MAKALAAMTETSHGILLEQGVFIMVGDGYVGYVIMAIAMLNR